MHTQLRAGRGWGCGGDSDGVTETMGTLLFLEHRSGRAELARLPAAVSFGLQSHTLVRSPPTAPQIAQNSPDIWMFKKASRLWNSSEHLTLVKPHFCFCVRLQPAEEGGSHQWKMFCLLGTVNLLVSRLPPAPNPLPFWISRGQHKPSSYGTPHGCSDGVGKQDCITLKRLLDSQYW
jgi:hypothetical protein